jgi:hypothetical protein
VFLIFCVLSFFQPVLSCIKSVRVLRSLLARRSLFVGPSLHGSQRLPKDSGPASFSSRRECVQTSLPFCESTTCPSSVEHIRMLLRSGSGPVRVFTSDVISLIPTWFPGQTSAPLEGDWQLDRPRSFLRAPFPCSSTKLAVYE